MSYADFLTGVAGCHADVLPFLQSVAKSLFGLGIDAVPAQDAWGLGRAGFQGMGLTPTSGPGTNLDAVPYDHEPYFFHFPDGNATLARLLVRRLIPAAHSGHDGGRPRDRARRLRTARRGGGDRPGAPGEHGRARAPPRRARRLPRGRGRLRPGTPARDGAGSARRARLLELRDPPHRPRPSRGAEGGARVRGEGADRLHERAPPRLEGVGEGGGPRDGQPRQLLDATST